MSKAGDRLPLERPLRELMRAPSPFDQLYGLEFLVCTDELVTGRVKVGSQVTQPFGMVHGGVYASIAEALASTGTNIGVADANEIGVGLSNHTSFLRPIVSGDYVHGAARRRHRGRTTWLWEVDLTDDEGRLCATSRLTVAVRSL